MSDETNDRPPSPQVSPDGRFWWDGTTWQPMPSDDHTTAAGPKPVKEKNTLGTISLVVAIIGFVFACIPGALIVGWVLLPIAFILSLVALFQSKKKGRAIAGLIISVVGTVVGVVVFLAVVSNAFEDAVDDATTSSASDDEKADDGSFENDVLETKDVRIEITDHRVIAVGEKGNEYGEKPVIAFAYDITNVSGERVDPITGWISVISAEQDNNPDAVNALEVGALPDDKFLDSQTENIKKGGTVANSIAYELDDESTPVELVASDDLALSEIGRITYKIK